MGCWNETCGLSNLAIKSGERIKFFILAKVGKNSKTYYTNDMYIPLCLPMNGEYDDYGSVEKINSEFKETEELLKNLELYTVLSDDEEFKKYEFESLSQLIEDISRDDIYFNYHKEYYPLTLAMYHEDLYNTLVKDYATRKPYNKNVNIKDLWKDKIDRHYRKYVKRFNELKELLKLGIMKDEDECEYFELALSEPVFRTSQYSFDFTKAYMKFLNDDNIELYKELLSDFIMFSYTLSSLRSGFFCVSGLGSQSNEMHIPKLIAEWVLKYIENYKKDYEEEYEEDFNDDYLKETVYFSDYIG